VLTGVAKCTPLTSDMPKLAQLVFAGRLSGTSAGMQLKLEHKLE
jgi:hypothetical protein